MSSKSTLEMQENVKTERQQLWVQVPQMFQGIAIQLAISFIIVANRAMQRNGMIEDQKTGRESTIDFGELAKLMKMPDVVADLVALQDPKNKVVTAAVQSMQHNIKLLGHLCDAVKTAFLIAFQNYNALYSDHSKDAGVKEAASIDILGGLERLGVSAEAMEMVNACCFRHLTAQMALQRQAVYDNVKLLVDMFINGTHANVTQQAIEESVLRELPQDCVTTPFM